MDWKHVKTLFILLLLLLNLFLAASLFYGSAAGSGQQEYEAHAADILAARGIALAGEWPEAPQASGMIRFDNGSPSNEKLLERLMPGASVGTDEKGVRHYLMGNRTLTESSGAESGNTDTIYEDFSAGYQLDASSDEKRDREILSLFSGIGLGSYRLTLDDVKATEEGTLLTYVQAYKRGKLFDNKVLLLLRDSGIVRIVLSLHPVRQMIAPANGSAGEALTSVQAVMLSSLKGPLSIKAVEFGWCQADEGELYFSPAWRVKLEDGQEVRLDAYTGNRLLN
jgi:hypothetical protein